MNTIRWIIQSLMIHTYVQWDDGELLGDHYSWTVKDALQWIACYPNSCRVTMIDLRPFPFGKESRMRGF